MDKDYTITFFYYEDLAEPARFYERVLGFELVLDQAVARIYRVAGRCYFEEEVLQVDGNKGHLRHQDRSAVVLTIVTQDVKGWHERLRLAGVPKLTEIRRGAYLEHFFFEDPAGYAIEIQRFHDPAVAALF